MSTSGDVVRAPSGVMHGKTSPVFHTNIGLLEGLDKWVGPPLPGGSATAMDIQAGDAVLSPAEIAVHAR